MQVVGHGYYGSIFRAAGLFAKRQARLQFYVKEPIILYMESIQKSRLYDVLNVTALLAMYLGLLAVLSQVIGRINSLIVVGFVMLSFPLHFFYTIPHGYPIGETYGAMLALFSAAFLAQYLKSRSRTMLLLSVVLFLISLTGSEYALIVSPALVLVVYLSIRPSRRPLFLLWYAAAWLVYATAWSVYHAVNGGGGRTAFEFEPEKFAESWTFLQQNAIVPIALIKGIPTNSPLAQGGPPVPSLLRYDAILPWGELTGALVLGIVLWALCTWALWQCRLSRREGAEGGSIFGILAIVPAIVLCMSQLYQELLPKHYIFGHVVSFYSQLGAAGILFLCFALVCSAFQSIWRIISCVALGGVAAFSILVTLAYNNANYQVLSAHQQKWNAFDMLADYVYGARPDLISALFEGPGFWAGAGVSVVSDRLWGSSVSFWTDYSYFVLHKPLMVIAAAQEQTKSAVYVNYYSTPSGSPIVLLYEPPNGDHAGQVTILAAKRVRGVLSYQALDGSHIKHAVNNWTCDKFCTMRFTQPGDSKLTTTASFIPSKTGPRNFLAQLAVPRGGAFAYSYGGP